MGLPIALRYLLFDAGFNPVYWVLSSGGTLATLDIDFVNNRAWNNGTVTIASLLSVTRASIGYYQNAAGVLSQFANNTLRYGTNGLLVEESRTNILLQSQAFNNASWTQSQLTETDNSIAAPDGTITAGKLVENTAANVIHQLSSAVISKAASAIQYTATVYAKQNNRRLVFVMGDANFAGGFAQVVFDLVGGQIGVAASVSGGTPFSGASAAISTLANGWYRCTLTATSNTSTSLEVAFNLDNATGTQALSQSYTGDGVSGVYLWGGQIEQAAFATSYIPTTSSSATRAADDVRSTGISWLTQGIGTFSVQYVTSNPGNNVGLMSLNDGSGSNRVDLRANGAGALASAISTGGVNIALLSPANGFTLGALNKVAVAYQNSDQACVLNNGTPATNASGTVMTVATQLEVGELDGQIVPIDGYIKRLSYWNSRLSNTALGTLTT